MSNEILGETREGTGAIRKQGKRLVFEETYTFIVKAQSKTTSRLSILATPGIPRVGYTLSAGGFAICQNVDAARDPINPEIWRVSASFSSDVQEDTSGANESQSGDPTAWTPIAELSFETYTEPVKIDANGDPITNSAKQVIQGTLNATRTIVRYDFEQFEQASLDIDDIADRNEKVNSAVYDGRAAKSLKLTVRSATLGYYYGYKVWRIAYSMAYKPDLWTAKILDIGNTYLSGGVLVEFVDAQNNRIIGNLNGAGGRAADGNPPAVIQKDVFQATNFNFLRV
jgi:hypothetical protein